MGIEKVGCNKRKNVLIILFIVYILLTLSLTLLIREPLGKELIQTKWFLGYKSSNIKLIHRDNLFNFLLFVPIGIFFGQICNKYKIVYAVLMGLFLSETIECSQLIWQLGTFDVDDLFFNTLGAFVGGVLTVIIALVKRLNKNSF